MQLLVQLLLLGADPATSSISSHVGEEERGGGTSTRTAETAELWCWGQTPSRQ